ncbi:hypothetical protein JX265_000760 [Neoarthrinium moseri]|uniref:WW domain-containing protein n=1 Tax=Neoarthrinium moseri TaxID=1658444 RepID=A0A9P9WWK2_9PEZI|nr:uncharacterized protein JN550_007133 [Neoarthrinium moseri]KAI1867402.1 hypothetical protein JN550_007133 [Neoarthrinium moseri]KAI1880520.1 hypothetical protein JX265_000760 [Neoarthrinium moseri]
MLRSTYQPSHNAPPPLPPGWTEHKAPTGHTYYYNTTTQESTYKRPGADIPLPAAPTPPASGPQDPRASYRQYAGVGSLANPAAANAFLAQYNPQAQRQQQHQQPHGARGHGDRPRPQPHDKPRSKVAIPGCEPWVLVYTKYGRRFAYNPEKRASYWRIPEKIMQGVIELDIRGAKEKAEGKIAAQGDEAQDGELAGPGDNSTKEIVTERPESAHEDEAAQEELGSDYEEVEVTDDEASGAEGAEDDGDGEHPSKRQRTEEPNEDDREMPVEFNEDDIAFQLQAMGADYGLEPGEYDDGNPEAWPEGAEGEPLSNEDARELFKDLLTDMGINPFSPWDKLVEDGKLVDDPRYTVLPNMKARREVWEEWSRAQIQVVKERRAREEKKDPRIPYMAFLEAKANPRLYWPEFKRKYRKEPPMRDSALADRDREKAYREHVARLKLPLDTLKKDVAALLRAVPGRELNAKTLLEDLPAQVLTDVRYTSLDAATRDPLIAAYIATLPPPPDQAEAEEDEAARRARDERRKREKAMQERERIVAEEKRRQQRQLEHGRAALREEERELEKAMHVGKKGIHSQLLAEREKGLLDEGAAKGDGDIAMD